VGPVYIKTVNIGLKAAHAKRSKKEKKLEAMQGHPKVPKAHNCFCCCRVEIAVDDTTHVV
jgi:hypothetical protein